MVDDVQHMLAVSSFDVLNCSHPKKSHRKRFNSKNALLSIKHELPSPLWRISFLMTASVLHWTAWISLVLLVKPKRIFFFLNSPSPWHFYFICHFSLEMFSSPLVLLTEVSILLPHLLDPIIPSSSTLPFPTPFLHSLSTFYKEPPLGIRWFFVNPCFGILSPSFFVYPVINFHWSPPIVLDSPGIQT